MSKTGPQAFAATEEAPGRAPVWYLVSGLCAFIALLAFKPSEPYLSDYLICDEDTAEQECSDAGDASSCSNKDQCYWSGGSCRLIACSDVSQGDCGDGPDDAFSYCETDGDVCRVAECYKHFSADQVNNDIYPVSTYAYLPLLLLLGIGAELVSYRAAVLTGAFGRVLTRFLLLYADSVPAMQAMQVCYSAGTAAEDVFAAFVFKAVPFHNYQLATSLTKAAGHLSHMLSGIVGDLLVEGDVRLTTLFIISTVCVCMGLMVGVFVIVVPSVGGKQGMEGDEGGLNARLLPVCTEKDAAEADFAAEGRMARLERLCGVLREHFRLLRRVLWDAEAVRCVGDEGQGQGKDEESNGHGETRLGADAEHHRDEGLVVLSPLVPGFGAGGGIQGAAPDHAHTHTPDIELRHLALWWVLGNAVYMTVYNYEVSIYQELNGGSDEWNGSAIAVLLVMGIVGAALPTHPVLAAALLRPPSRRMLLLGVALGTGLSVLVFVAAWELYASVGSLALLFCGWNFVTVVFYAWLGSAVAEAHISHSDDPAYEPPFSISLVAMVACSALAQVVLSAVLFGGLRLAIRPAATLLSLCFAALVALYCCAMLKVQCLECFKGAPP